MGLFPVGWGAPLALYVMAAFLVDLIVGDPAFLTHPVIYMGRLISWGEKILHRPGGSPGQQRLAGAVLSGVVVLITYGVGWLLVLLAAQVGKVVMVIVSVWLISTTIAARGLGQEAIKVYRLLTGGHLDGARKAVGGIVGRDTEELDKAGVIRATVESVAENTVDAVVAPLFYAALGGAPLALAYRAINTLDSMLGYKNERFLYFGWAAARLDDVANFLPARITAVLLVLGAAVWRYSAIRTWRILRRDGRKHPSPNSGLAEAAVAGALGIQLGGRNTYQGQVSERPHLGDPLRPLEVEDIVRAVRLMITSGVMAATLPLLSYLQFR